MAGPQSDSYSDRFAEKADSRQRYRYGHVYFVMKGSLEAPHVNHGEFLGLKTLFKEHLIYRHVT